MFHMQFRLQSLEQELDLVRNESQRNAADLNALQESSSNDRRTKVRDWRQSCVR